VSITPEQLQEVRDSVARLHQRAAEVEANYITAAEAALHRIDALVRIALAELEQGEIPSLALLDAAGEYEQAVQALRVLAEMATDRSGRPL